MYQPSLPQLLLGPADGSRRVRRERQSGSMAFSGMLIVKKTGHTSVLHPCLGHWAQEPPTSQYTGQCPITLTRAKSMLLSIIDWNFICYKSRKRVIHCIFCISLFLLVLQVFFPFCISITFSSQFLTGLPVTNYFSSNCLKIFFFYSVIIEIQRIYSSQFFFPPYKILCH